MIITFSPCPGHRFFTDNKLVSGLAVLKKLTREYVLANWKYQVIAEILNISNDRCCVPKTHELRCLGMSLVLLSKLT
jgi:hypothetical protein